MYVCQIDTAVPYQRSELIMNCMNRHLTLLIYHELYEQRTSASCLWLFVCLYLAADGYS
jgi:hypothetical protein